MKHNMKKTFKLGEYCAGGIIHVKISNDGNSVTFVNSEFATRTILGVKVFRWPLDLFNIELYLNDLTTSYYASKIIDYIKEKTK